MSVRVHSRLDHAGTKCMSTCWKGVIVDLTWMHTSSQRNPVAAKPNTRDKMICDGVRAVSEDTDFDAWIQVFGLEH